MILVLRSGSPVAELKTVPSTLHRSSGLNVSAVFCVCGVCGGAPVCVRFVEVWEKASRGTAIKKVHGSSGHTPNCSFMLASPSDWEIHLLASIQGKFMKHVVTEFIHLLNGYFKEGHEVSS